MLAFVLPAVWVMQKLFDLNARAWEKALQEELCDDEKD
jgi:hypothetical protein